MFPILLLYKEMLSFESDYEEVQIIKKCIFEYSGVKEVYCVEKG